ncbi:hypothetical protein [Schlesneria paludicola]|uniref:hypothetical protein n=1 Tax=Schlesneria paludicola TaxID=360056 RepID=UPI00029A32F6|nr:hypothetical protein [Schlesneria paludicola]
MPTQTIRDVLIKVALENGNMKLGPVDTSAFASAVEKVRSDWQSLAAEMKRSPLESTFSAINFAASNAVSQIQNVESVLNRTRAKNSIGASDTSATQTAARNNQNAMRFANQNMQTSGQNNGQGSIKIGMPRYGQSVRDRASESAQASIKSTQESGLLSGAADKDLERLQAQLEKRAAMLIREQDRESANGERAAEQEKKRQDALADRAEQGAMRIAKGIGSLIDGSSKASSEFSRMLESVQAAYNIGKDISSAIHSVAGSSAKPTSSVGALPTAAAPNTQASTSAVSDLASATKGAASANGLLSASTLGLTAGLAAVALAIKGTITLLEQARDTNQAYAQSVADDAVRSVGYQSRKMLRTNEERRAIAMERPDTSEQELAGVQLQQNEEREANIRRKQAEARKSGMSEDRVAEIRTRDETEGRQRQSLQIISGKREFLEQRMKDVKEARAALDDPATKDVMQSTRDSASGAIKSAKQTQSTTILGTLGKGLAAPLGGLVSENWIDNSTGGVSSHKAEKSKEDTQVALMNLEIGKRDETSQVAVQKKQLAEDELKTKKEYLSALVQEHDTTKNIVQEARKKAEVEESRTRNAMLSFGSLDPGSQAQLRIINEKSKRIDEQQRRKDAGEDVNVEQWTHFELQTGFGKGNKRIDASMNRQKQEDAKKSGIFDDDIAEVQQLHNDAETLATEAKPQQDAIRDEIDKLSGEMKQSAGDVVEAMKNVFGTKQALDEIRNRLDGLESQNRLNEKVRGNYFS